MENGFFLVSKIAWSILAPDRLLVVLMVALSIVLWQGRIRLARAGLTILAAALFLIVFLPVDAWLLSPLETRFGESRALPSEVDGIILLTGANTVLRLADGVQHEVNYASAREFEFLALARRYPDAKLVVVGGSSHVTNNKRRAADTAKAILKDNGLDVSRVTFERESRNTFENAINAKQLVKPLQGERWLLITSAFHMPRAVGVFCRIGWNVIPFPVHSRPTTPETVDADMVDARHRSRFSIALREWVGLFAYFVTGKTSEFLPRGCV